MDFIKNKVQNKMNKDAQPGNNVEASADNAANQGMYFCPSISNVPPHYRTSVIPSTDCAIDDTTEVNKLAGDAGVPQAANGTIDAAVDDKINSEIPGGNN